MPKTLLVKWLLSLLAASLVSSSIVGWLLHRQGLETGIEAYHTACRIGGILIDKHGKAVYCKPIDLTEKELNNNAPSLFS